MTELGRGRTKDKWPSKSFTSSKRPKRSKCFDDSRDALASADAGARHPELLLPPAQLVQERVRDACAARAERVSERDGPAVGIEARRVEVQFVHAREHLRGERLVDLYYLHVVEFHASS